MDNIIDARGRSCPEPVIMIKNEIDKNNNKSFKVLVDTHVAVENITRFVEGKGYNISTEELNGEFRLNIEK